MHAVNQKSVWTKPSQSYQCLYHSVQQYLEVVNRVGLAKSRYVVTVQGYEMEPRRFSRQGTSQNHSAGYSSRPAILLMLSISPAQPSCSIISNYRRHAIVFRCVHRIKQWNEPTNQIHHPLSTSDCIMILEDERRANEPTRLHHSRPKGYQISTLTHP